MNIVRKMLAEFIGTFTLVFLGCGAAVIAGSTGDGAALTGLGIVGISFAFGFALIGMAYGIGPISGCHINPAVSLGAVVAGRMTVFEMVRYWAAQVGGAVVAAIVLLAILKGKQSGYDLSGGLGNNGWGAGYLGEYGMVVIHLVGIQITGVSVNPARSIGPAIISAKADSIVQLWLFIVAPMLGAFGAGVLKYLSNRPSRETGAVFCCAQTDQDRRTRSRTIVTISVLDLRTTTVGSYDNAKAIRPCTLELIAQALAGIHARH